MLGTLLARLVSYPRNRYQEDGHDLDLAFITDRICVTSLPSVTFPERLYRNRLSHIKALLDAKAHGHYRIFDLRAEGCGYSDADFDGRVTHFPFVDHHPPPFFLLPRIAASIDAHLTSSDDALAVIHCKAGKGRSGLSTCSYLVAHASWREEDARALFTAKRMRSGFGEGVSIPSQRRYLRYLSLWTQRGRRYAPRTCRVGRIEVEGLGSGSQLALKAFAKEGAEIVTVFEFDGSGGGGSGGGERSRRSEVGTKTVLEAEGGVVMDADVCVYLTKGNAFAHFWFNTYFETTDQREEGSFTIAWEQVDGWKGTKWRGARAYQSITVFWTNL